MVCPRRLKRLSDVSASDWCDLEVFLMHLYDEKSGITNESSTPDIATHWSTIAMELELGPYHLKT